MGLIYAPQRLAEGIAALRRRAGISAPSWSAPASRAFAAGATAFRPCCTSSSSSRSRSTPRRRCIAGSPGCAGRSCRGRFSRSTTRRCAAAASAGRRWITPGASPRRSPAVSSISPGSPRPTTMTAAAALIALKGIGRWSAEIYLIFALGRADIWPAADLGLQFGIGGMPRARRAAGRARAARDRRTLAAVALGRRVPVLAILSARPPPHRAAAARGTLCVRRLGFRQL